MLPNLRPIDDYAEPNEVKQTLGNITCRQCKLKVDSITILEHYWNFHPIIAKQVYNSRMNITKKLDIMIKVAKQGMIGYK